MKKNISLKKVMLPITFITVILLMASFISKSNLSSSIKNDRKTIFTKLVEEHPNKDSAFLIKASEINLKEIQLGQLAYLKGKSYHVRQLGELIKIGHSQSQRDLTTLAKSKKINIPTNTTVSADDLYDELYNKSGDDFDIAYVNMTLNEHKEAIEIFKIASEECTDKEIKAWAKITLPILQKHLDYAIESQFKFE